MPSSIRTCESRPTTTRIDAGNALDIIARYDIVADGSDNFATRYLVSDACYLAKRTLVFAAVGPFDGYVTTFKPHERGPDGEPYPSYRCIFPEPPPPGTVANCAEVGVLGAAVGVIGTLQATEVLKEIFGIGESLAGRLLLYDARLRASPRSRWPGTRPIRCRASRRPFAIFRSMPAGSQARCARPDGTSREAGANGDPRHPVRQGWHPHRLLAHLGADQPRCRRFCGRRRRGARRGIVAARRYDPDTDRVTPGSPLAAGSLLDIAEAFAGPWVAPAARSGRGHRGIFRAAAPGTRH